MFNAKAKISTNFNLMDKKNLPLSNLLVTIVRNQLLKEVKKSFQIQYRKDRKHFSQQKAENTINCIELSISHFFQLLFFSSYRFFNCTQSNKN